MRDVIAVDSSNNVRDASWAATDAAGHVHRWVDEKLPSVEWVETDRWWCSDCRDEHVETEPRCVQCGAVVDMTKAYRDLGPGRQFITGESRIWLNDELVSREALEVPEEPRAARSLMAVGWTKMPAWERAEIRRRHKDHPELTHRQLGLEFGYSVSTISRTVGRRTGRIGAPRKRGPCAICGRTPEQVKIQRFTLSCLPKRGLSSRGAGALDLCDECWTRRSPASAESGVVRWYCRP